MTKNELIANIIMHKQQIDDINRTISKLDDRQCADGTAILILTKARWTLSQEILGYRESLSEIEADLQYHKENAPLCGDWK